MLQPIDSRAKGSPHKGGFVSNSQPLEGYASMLSNEGLVPEQAHLTNNEKGVHGATSVGEAKSC